MFIGDHNALLGEGVVAFDSRRLVIFFSAPRLPECQDLPVIKMLESPADESFVVSSVRFSLGITSSAGLELPDRGTQ